MNNSANPATSFAWIALAVAIVAVITGLPSLRGSFLAGDDYHLVLNHLLVNHPSPAHAWEILTIVHRDLYQPIPLLSFSLDFVVIDALGLLPTADGPNAGAWMFHLTNVLIHAVNAVLVLFVIRRLSMSARTAVVGALLFTVHPLSAESIAWLNGRMMLLSACFTLATVLAFERWEEKGTPARGALVLLFSFLAHMSKVSVAIPVLVAIGPLVRAKMPPKRWWPMWIAVAVISGLFTLFNISFSEEMFEVAESEMTGPKFLYCLLALEQYFRQYVLPIGLSVWYPPPADLSWTEPAVISAYATVALVVALTALSFKWTRVGVLGMIWFFTAVFPTLPIVPARRAIGADRYVYLPQIGLAWITATLLVWVYLRARSRARTATTSPHQNYRWLVLPAVIVGIVFVGVSWKTQGYHRTDIDAALRNIQTNPDFPGVYKQAAWAYYRHGRYQEAIDIAQSDIEKHPDRMACEVFQVIGMSQFRLGQIGEAIQSLNNAIEADPKYGKSYSRLAQIQAHIGDHESAIKNYEHSLEIMPFYNPAWIPLGYSYREVGRTDDAVRAFEEALKNNPFDITAHLALAEIDIERGDYASARERLEEMLGYVPENVAARTNLGVVLQALGQHELAMDAFQAALERDPRAVIAAMNLANIHDAQGQTDRAERIYIDQLERHGDRLDLLVAYHDFAAGTNRPAMSAAAFIRAYNQKPDDLLLRAWTAYALAQSDQHSEAVQLLNQLPPSDASAIVHRDAPIPLLTRILIALEQDAPQLAREAADGLLQSVAHPNSEFIDRLLADLERFAGKNPDNPWPYYFTAQALVARDNLPHARLALDEFTRRCPTEECQALALKLIP